MNSGKSLAGITIISEYEAKSILRDYGIRTPAGILVDKLPDSIKLSYPLVMKVSDERILHKSDVGGVKVGIKNRTELAKEFRAMRKKFPSSLFLIEEMKPGGVEFIIGVTRDPVFGQVLMLGSGGIYTELYHDVVIRKLPISRREAEDMISGIRSGVFCTGFRGTRINCKLLADVLVRISGMVESGKINLETMDLNPVIVAENEVTVLDAKMSISKYKE